MTPGRSFVLVLLTATTLACGEASPDASGDAPGASREMQGLVGTVAEAARGIPSVVMLRPGGTAVGRAVADTVRGADAGSDGRTGSLPAPTPGATGDSVPVTTIDQFGLAFSPDAVVVPRGGTLRFTNSKASLVHNVEVRSLATDTVLFSGDATSGQVIDVTLEYAGGYDIRCDYHPGMTAFVFVTDAPYATLAESDGTFSLEAPPGAYTLEVWNVDTEARRERAIVLDGGSTTLSPDSSIADADGTSRRNGGLTVASTPAG